MTFQRLRENRMQLQESEAKFNEANKRLNNTKQGGIANQSADQIFQKLQKVCFINTLLKIMFL